MLAKLFHLGLRLNWDEVSKLGNKQGAELLYNREKILSS